MKDSAPADDAPPLPPDGDLRFEPTRAAGLDRLRDFVPRAGRDYAANRNHDLPGHPHVSSLSPYVRHRAVTEAEVAAAVLDRFAPSTAQKFLQEVVWRTYWKGWLERRPAVWDWYLRDLDAARNRLATESGLRRGWEAACRGETGIAPFDAWARELARTGYMHNHARMWFASIWVHTLHLPWELGADFFLRHLLDGDPASNTLSWRWVAGLHTRGKTYVARASNIGKYTGGRFDTSELGHRLTPGRDVAALEGPPAPDPAEVPDDADLTPGLRTGLLLHDEDMHPAYLFKRGLRPVAGAMLIQPRGRSPFEVSARVVDFTLALAEDAVARHGGDMDVAAPTQSIADIRAWAGRAALQQIVTPYAPVGPTRTALDALAAQLDIPLVRPIRAWDQAAWPHCTAGFFKLKKRMPDILETVIQD